MSQSKFSKFWYVVLILLLANLAAQASVAKSQKQDHARLMFLDVGQGDAIYLRTPFGNDILIDGGPGDTILGRLGRVMPFADRTIELMIVTHPHADHIAGLVVVLKRFLVKTVLISEVVYSSQPYAEFQRLLTEEEARVIHPLAGQRIFLDEGTVFDVYYPLVKDFNSLPKDLNDVSIVGKISLGESQILLTGDAGTDIENILLLAGFPLQSEVLKIGHHGSRHSTSQQFIEKVDPDYSVISVGKNSYGHPHSEVLGLLTEASTKILRTDEHGDVIFAIYPDRVELQKK